VGIDQEVVPVALPLPPTLFTQDTCVTPTLSDAVPARASVEELVANVPPVVGEVIATIGAVVSPLPAFGVNTTSTQ
jgi:hypothetical protein